MWATRFQCTAAATGCARPTIYMGAGIFALTDRDDIHVAIRVYDGASLVPVDLTFDVGVVMDTNVGLVKLGFSTFIGFLPDL